MLRKLTTYRTDWWVGIGLAFVTAGAAFLLSYPALHPMVWGDYASAAGLHPSAHVGHALWSFLARETFARVGLDGLVRILPMAGCAMLGLMAAMAFATILYLLMSLAPITSHPVRQLTIMRISAVLGAVGFATSPALWNGAQAFSPGFLNAFLVSVSLVAFARFFFFGGRSFATLSFVPIALVLIDTPFAFLPAFLLLAIVIRRWWVNASGDTFRETISRVRWRSTLLSGAAAATLVVVGYRIHWAEWSAAGMADDPLAFARTFAVAWWSSLGTEATTLGWLLALALVLMPLSGQLFTFRRACDETRPFSFPMQLTILVCFCYELAQFVAGGRFGVVSGLSAHHMMGELFQIFATGLLATGLALSVTMLATEFLSRQTGLRQDIDGVFQVVSDTAPLRFHLGLSRVFVVLAVGIVVSFFVSASYTDRREALAMIDRYADLVLNDAKGCLELCTDGLVDEAFRLKAAHRGQKLFVRPMLSHGGVLDRYLLRAGLTSSEQLAASDNGSASWLRTRVREGGAADPSLAVQFGFEVWRRDLRRLPPGWGTLARFSGTDEERRHSRAAAYALGTRLSRESPREVRCDPVLSETLDDVRWRLARMAKYRAEEADRDNAGELAAAERSRREALDNANRTLGGIMKDLARSKSLIQPSVTPRESLRIALQNGNFAACEVWGTAILEKEPGNGEANYAMALVRVSQDDFASAAEHFRTCLKLKPSDPVLLNNMAMTLVNLDRFDEARAYAAKARRIAPHTDEIRRTQQLIEECAAIAATNGVMPRTRLQMRRKLSNEPFEKDF